MTRLIDADALAEQYTEMVERLLLNRGNIVPSDVTTLIVNAPTIDAVEVVKCEDCKYGSKDYPKDIFPDVTKETYSCEHSTYSHDKDFYCKYGKRNNNE